MSATLRLFLVFSLLFSFILAAPNNSYASVVYRPYQQTHFNQKSKIFKKRKYLKRWKAVPKQVQVNGFTIALLALAFIVIASIIALFVGLIASISFLWQLGLIILGSLLLILLGFGIYILILFATAPSGAWE